MNCLDLLSHHVEFPEKVMFVLDGRSAGYIKFLVVFESYPLENSVGFTKYHLELSELENQYRLDAREHEKVYLFIRFSIWKKCDKYCMNRGG